MNDLVDQVKDDVKAVIGIEDLMNKEELKAKLLDYLNKNQ